MCTRKYVRSWTGGCLCQVSRAGIAETRRPSSSRGTTIDQPLSAVARRDESHRSSHDPRQRGHETILPPSFTKNALKTLNTKNIIFLIISHELELQVGTCLYCCFYTIFYVYPNLQKKTV